MIFIACKKHKIKVAPKYYDLVKSGKKKMILLLGNRKRKQIKIGDDIIFIDTKKRKINKKVIDIKIDKSFKDLLTKIDVKKTGFKTSKEVLEVLNKVFTQRKQEKYNVLAIEISESNQK
ncbi:MAG: ASCH domain-containing protein [Alphaproteobacteria bacterium]|jgi:ASC-1-like (ASCH) protein|nr:ASCH domain-containing protein [Alphaproteobacteria bacterium]MCV6599068.1 ASCH domain-containing protein [Alphaproteobacteria bacterium]